MLRLDRKLNRTYRRFLEDADVGFYVVLHGGGNRRTRRKPPTLDGRPLYPLTCRRRESNPVAVVKREGRTRSQRLKREGHSPMLSRPQFKMRINITVHWAHTV